MAVDPVDLSSELREAIDHARLRVESEVALWRQGRVEPDPLPVEVREAIEGLVRDGTYANAVAAVVAEEPDLADS